MHTPLRYAFALILVFTLTCVLFAGNLDIRFKKDHTEIVFQKINVQSYNSDKDKNAIVFFTKEPVKKDYIVVDYGVVNHIEMQKNSVIVFLKKRVNYTFSGDTLFLYPFYPQKGIIKTRIAPVYKKASEKSELETEVLIGTEVEALKDSKGWLYINIPEQNDYKGWVNAEFVNLFADTDKKDDYTHIVARKWELFTPDKGDPYELSAGTNYKLLREDKSRHYIELRNGDRGWIGSQHTIFTSTQTLRDRIVASTKQFLGTKYVWGGTSSQGIDCSGLTYTVYKIHNIQLPRNSTPQFEISRKIQRSQLRPGDLVFFQTIAKGPSHVGIFIGGSEFIHAGLEGVVIASLDEPYFAKRYYGSGVILPD